MKELEKMSSFKPVAFVPQRRLSTKAPQEKGMVIKMRKKIALVNQRYGLEINGGSEMLCRLLAERLKNVYDVEVITTCALEYTTWANYYRPGVEEINGVIVRRFKSDKKRNLFTFPQLTEQVLLHPHTDKQEENWIDEQGPFCPKLVKFIAKRHTDYKAIIFMTSMYYTTARSMLLDLDNAFLLPTLHDEPSTYLRFYQKVFSNSKALIYLTDEEKKFTEEHFNVENIPSIVTGCGVDVPSEEELEQKCNLKNIPDEYMLYLGRIDGAKGCNELFEYFLRFKARNKNGLSLLLAGKSVINIPKRDDIVYMGFVSDDEKFELIKKCKLLVLASEFESLSMVVLESMACKKPVLLNGKCMVLRGHCIKSNAGLYFENFYEFEGALNYMLNNKKAYEMMCENGKKYIDENYQWDIILRKISGLIEKVNTNETR